jgi:Flp pilus assembly protein TadG
VKSSGWVDMRRRIRARRAGVLLFFALILLPLSFFIGAIAVDYGRIVGVQQRANNLADAAALAATNEFASRCAPTNPDNRCLDPVKIQNMLNQMLSEAVSKGATRGLSDPKFTFTLTNNGPVINPNANPSTPGVTVKLTYKIEGLSYFGVTTALWSTGRTAVSTIDGVATRSAYVCDPDVARTNVGSCIRLR